MVNFGKLLPTAMKSGQGFISEQDPWLDYKSLKRSLYAICEERGLVIDQAAKGAGEAVMYPPKSALAGDALAEELAKSPAEKSFFEELDRQLCAISIFYDSTEGKLAARYDRLISGLRDFVSVVAPSGNSTELDGSVIEPKADDLEKAAPGSPAASSAGCERGSKSEKSPVVIAIGEDPEARAEFHLRLMTGLVGLFNHLVLLENYAVLNHCGFGKILKKHDKVTGWAGVKEAYMTARVNAAPFATHRRLRRLVQGAKCAYDLLHQLSPVPQGELVMDSDDADTLHRAREVKQGLRAERDAIIGSAPAAEHAAPPQAVEAGRSGTAPAPGAAVRGSSAAHPPNAPLAPALSLPVSGPGAGQAGSRAGTARSDAADSGFSGPSSGGGGGGSSARFAPDRQPQLQPQPQPQQQGHHAGSKRPLELAYAPAGHQGGGPGSLQSVGSAQAAHGQPASKMTRVAGPTGPALGGVPVTGAAMAGGAGAAQAMGQYQMMMAGPGRVFMVPGGAPVSAPSGGIPGAPKPVILALAPQPGALPVGLPGQPRPAMAGSAPMLTPAQYQAWYAQQRQMQMLQQQQQQRQAAGSQAAHAASRQLATSEPAPMSSAGLAIGLGAGLAMGRVKGSI